MFVMDAIGCEEKTQEEFWCRAGDATQMIAMAPDDEILGEILALQALPTLPHLTCTK
jgi:hypothetical protein